MIFLDTMALLYFVERSPRLPQALQDEIIATPLVYVSAISIWEIGVKGHLGKLSVSGKPVTPNAIDRLVKTCNEQNIAIVPVNERHAATAPFLNGSHKDPFDRLIVAQTLERDAVLFSSDRALDALSPKLRRRWMDR